MPPLPGLAARPALRVGATAATDLDAVAVEEPLEIRVDGERVATTMRTPGHDAHLAVGFLFAEGIIDSLADVGTVTRCSRPGDEGAGNVIDVRSGPGTSLDPDRVLDGHRFFVTSSACGVCGRRSIEALLARLSPVAPGPKVAPADIARAVDAIRDAQPLFARSGGVHAAAAYDAVGQRLVCREDVGRHNAVDKVVGDLLYRGLVGAPSGPALLVVSGRASFEIVQKAAAAGIGVIASVSAASSLAVDLACAAGITLCAFVRGGTLNVYSHPERLGLDGR
ncbi:Formate dehydrogenase chain D [Minicystis rosea]|nr:Formate dehydrogenase chain D [Minicystis rosea]